MDKENVLELLEKFIDRSERWIEDAVKREDWNDVAHYEGHKKAFEEMRSVILK